MAALIEPLEERRIQTLRVAFASGDRAHLAEVIDRWCPTPGERRYIVPALLVIGRQDLAREALAIMQADPRRDALNSRTPTASNVIGRSRRPRWRRRMPRQAASIAPSTCWR